MNVVPTKVEKKDEENTLLDLNQVNKFHFDFIYAQFSSLSKACL